MQSTMKISGGLRVQWDDYRLNLNSLIAQYSTLNENSASVGYLTLPSDWIWTPEITILNQVDSFVTTAPILFYNGNVMNMDWHREITTSTSCTLDFALYPFDTQSCFIEFSSSQYLANGLNISNLRTQLSHIRSKSISWNMIDMKHEIGLGFYNMFT